MKNCDRFYINYCYKEWVWLRNGGVVIKRVRIKKNNNKKRRGRGCLEMSREKGVEAVGQSN